MSAPKHTPGPWFIKRSKDLSGDIGISAEGLPNVLAETYCDIRRAGERANEECLANARLIAAAPELLSVLKAIREQLVKQDINFGPLIADAEAAIAKAGA